MKQSGLLSNFVWKFAERISAQLVSLIVSIVLARLLGPDDYGIVTIVMIFVYAFGNCKKSKSNYFKSYLLFMLIGIALYFILFIALISAGINITQYLE